MSSACRVGEQRAVVWNRVYLSPPAASRSAVGMASITEIATGAPGYSSVRPNSMAPLAMTLKLNGYATAQFGKNHGFYTSARTLHSLQERCCESLLPVILFNDQEDR